MVWSLHTDPGTAVGIDVGAGTRADASAPVDSVPTALHGPVLVRAGVPNFELQRLPW